MKVLSPGMAGLQKKDQLGVVLLDIAGWAGGQRSDHEPGRGRLRPWGVADPRLADSSGRWLGPGRAWSCAFPPPPRGLAGERAPSPAGGSACAPLLTSTGPRKPAPPSPALHPRPLCHADLEASLSRVWKVLEALAERQAGLLG